MTEEQLKAIGLTTDEGKLEFSRVAGEVLQPETVYCKPFQTTSSSGSGVMVFECEMCERQLFQITAFDGRKCNNFTPIPLTWPEAMKHFNKATEKHGRNMFDVIEQMYRETTLPMVYSKVEVLSWFLYKAQPERYLMAAVRCEYRSWPRLFFDGEGCNHKGCQNHISHPCEECGRTAAKGEIRSKGDN